MRTMNVIILHFATISPKAYFILVLTGKIKMAFEGIIKKYPIADTFINTHIKWDGSVKRILTLPKRISIGIPIYITVTTEIEIARLVT